MPPLLKKVATRMVSRDRNAAGEIHVLYAVCEKQRGQSNQSEEVRRFDQRVHVLGLDYRQYGPGLGKQTHVNQI